MQSLAVLLQVVICISLIGLVLVQHGKGADAGATFGGGASGAVFGSKGSSSFLVKVTTWVAIAFFANCLYMGALNRSHNNKSLMETVTVKDNSKIINKTDTAKK
jgi:preprotein translocase subunit SecG